MKLIILAQNVPYLISQGVPEANAQEIFDYLQTIDKDKRKILLGQIRKNPLMSIEDIKNFKFHKDFSQEIINLAKELEMPPDIINWAVEHKFDKKVIQWAKSINPNYIQWLLTQAALKNVRLDGEDDDAYRKILDKFDFMGKMTISSKEKDINTYKTYAELSEKVNQLVKDEDIGLEPMLNENYLVYNQDGVKVAKYEGTSPEVLKEAKRMCINNDDVSWCVGRDNYNTTYLSKGPLFLFLIDNKREVLIHVQEGQIKNRQNTSLSDYKIIKKIQPIMESFGIDPATTYDWGNDIDKDKFVEMMEIGEEVNERIETAPSIHKEINDMYEDERIGSDVLCYISDPLYENPTVRQVATQVYQRWITEHPNPFHFLDFYDTSSNALRTIPEIKEMNKNEAIRAFANPAQVENTYMRLGRELKVYPEIQTAYKNAWKKSIEESPKQFGKAPPNIQETLKQFYSDLLTKKIEEGTKEIKTSKDIEQKLFNILELIPEDLKDDPLIEKPLNLIWKTIISQAPKEILDLFIRKYFLVGHEWENYVVPQKIKETSQYKIFINNVMAPFAIEWLVDCFETRGRDFLRRMLMAMPEEIFNNPVFQTKTTKQIKEWLSTFSAETNYFYDLDDEVINKLKTIPQIAKLDQYTKNKWLKRIKDGDYDLYDNLPDKIKALPEFIQADKIGMAIPMTNLDPLVNFDEILNMYNNRFTRKSIAELITDAFIRDKLIPSCIAKLNNNSYEGLQIVNALPKQISLDEEVVAACRNAVVKIVSNLLPGESVPYNLIPIPLQNDQIIESIIMRQKKGLKTFKEKDYKVEEANSNNWYKSSKNTKEDIDPNDPIQQYIKDNQDKPGTCLQKALDLIEVFPELKLVKGKPLNPHDTNHFWTEDAQGNIYDPTANQYQNPTYQKERIVDPNSVRKEIKIAQEIIGDDDPHPNKYNPNYFDVGHSYTKAFPILWALKDGKIITKVSKYKEMMHTHEWTGKVNFLGRFEPETGILSIAKWNEGIHRLRPVPEILITMLKQTFPNITKIMVFN